MRNLMTLLRGGGNAPARKLRTPLRERREVQVAERRVPLTICEHPRASRMTLRIEPGGRGLKMTVPNGLPRREIDLFLARQAEWLVAKLARFESHDEMGEGAILPLRGVRHEIRLTGKARGLTQAVMVDGVATLRVGGGQDHVRRRIRDFLKREARRDLAEAVARHTATLGRPAESMTLKDTTSRWGSCTSDGRLSFSWRIVMAPPLVIDYLAAHEVAHLQEMNHGPRFWALCNRLCPQTPAARAWLKEHGTLLHAIDLS